MRAKSHDFIVILRYEAGKIFLIRFSRINSFFPDYEYRIKCKTWTSPFYGNSRSEKYDTTYFEILHAGKMILFAQTIEETATKHKRIGVLIGDTYLWTVGRASLCVSNIWFRNTFNHLSSLV